MDCIHATYLYQGYNTYKMDFSTITSIYFGGEKVNIFDKEKTEVVISYKMKGKCNEKMNGR